MEPRQIETSPELTNRNRSRLNQKDACQPQGPREEASAVAKSGVSGTCRPTGGWVSKPDADPMEELQLCSFKTERSACTRNASSSSHLISGWRSKPDSNYSDRKEVAMDREHCDLHGLGQDDMDDYGRADRSENWRKDSVLKVERFGFRKKGSHPDKYYSENRLNNTSHEGTDFTRTTYLNGTSVGHRNESRKEPQRSSRLDTTNRSISRDNSSKTCSSYSSESDENDRNKSISRKYGEIGNVTGAEGRINRTKNNINSLKNGSGDNIKTIESRNRTKGEGSRRRNRTTSSDSSLVGNISADMDKGRSRTKGEGSRRRNRTTSSDSSLVRNISIDMDKGRSRTKGEGSRKRNRTTSSDSSLVGNISTDMDKGRNRTKGEGSRRRNRTTSSDSSLVGNTSIDMDKGRSRKRVNELKRKQGDHNRKHGGCGSKKQEDGSRNDRVGDGGKRHGEESSRKHVESSSKKQVGGTSRRTSYMSIEDSLGESTDTDSKSSRSSTADKSAHRGRRKAKESIIHWTKDHDTSLGKGTNTDSNESSSTESSVDGHKNNSRKNTYVKERSRTLGSDGNKRNSKAENSEGSSDDSDADERWNDDSKKSKKKEKKACEDIWKTSNNRKPTPIKNGSSKSMNRSNSVCEKEKRQHGYTSNSIINNDNVIMDSIRCRIQNYDSHTVETSSGEISERKRHKTFVTSRKEEKYSPRASGLRSSLRKKSSGKKIRSESKTKYESETPNKTRSKSDSFEIKRSHDEGSSSDILSSGERRHTSQSDNRSENCDERRRSNYVAGRNKTFSDNFCKHNGLASNVSKNRTPVDNVSKTKPSADGVSKSKTSARSSNAKPPPNDERRNGEMKMNHHDYSENHKDREHLSKETDLQIDDEFQKIKRQFPLENCNTASSIDQLKKDTYLLGGSELLTLTEDEFNFIMGNDSSQPTRRVPLADSLHISPGSFVDLLTPTPMTKGASSSSVAGSSTSSNSVFPEISDSTNGNYKWQFQNRDGIWITYGKVVPLNADIWPSTTSEDIEKHYASLGSNVSMLFGSETHSWVINFQKKVQINRRTLEKCPIRRILNTSENCDEILGQDASIHHEWQFRAESGDWITIGKPVSNSASNLNKNTSDYIEKRYLKNPEAAALLITINGKFYELDFTRMTKTPLDFQNSKSSQPVRRIPKPPHPSNLKHDQLRDFSKVEAESKSSTATVTEYEWYFKDEKNCWIKYGEPNTLNNVACIPTSSSDDIEKHYKESPTKCMQIGSPQHTYLINFIKMTQTNIRTRIERPMARMQKYSKSGTEDHVPTGNRDKEKNNTDGIGFRPSPVADPFPQHYEEFLKDFSENQTFSKDFLPSHWSPMSSSASWRKILVTPSSNEYNERLAAIRKSNPTFRIQNLYRVQNEYLWRAYINKKKYLEQQYSGIKFKEEYLFHGTDPKNVDAICVENVDWRLHGTKHGNAFGRGSYFSNSAQISAGYSKSRVTERRTKRTRLGTASGTPLSGIYTKHLRAWPQQWSSFAAASSAPSGPFGAPHPSAAQHHKQAPTGLLRVMFIVRVLIGRTILGNTNTIMPPRDGSGVPYDTTVNNVARPSIFVKYDSQEYYPEYIVEFF